VDLGPLRGMHPHAADTVTYKMTTICPSVNRLIGLPV
jgi:hypothetical protein